MFTNEYVVQSVIYTLTLGGFLFSFFNKKSILFKNEKDYILIEKKNKNIKTPVKKTPGSTGYDICPYDGGNILPLSRKLISTGIKIKIPDNYYGRIVSLSLIKGIEVSSSIIDSDCCEEIKFLLYNHTNNIFNYTKDDKIAQLIFTKFNNFVFKDSILTPPFRNEGYFDYTNNINNNYNEQIYYSTNIWNSKEKENNKYEDNEIKETENNKYEDNEIKETENNKYEDNEIKETIKKAIEEAIEQAILYEKETKEEETSEEETSEEETKEEETSEEETSEEETSEEEEEEISEETKEEETSEEVSSDGWNVFNSITK